MTGEFTLRLKMFTQNLLNLLPRPCHPPYYCPQSIQQLASVFHAEHIEPTRAPQDELVRGSGVLIANTIR